MACCMLNSKELPRNAMCADLSCLVIKEKKKLQLFFFWYNFTIRLTLWHLPYAVFTLASGVNSEVKFTQNRYLVYRTSPCSVTLLTNIRLTPYYPRSTVHCQTMSDIMIIEFVIHLIIIICTSIHVCVRTVCTSYGLLDHNVPQHRSVTLIHT